MTGLLDNPFMYDLWSRITGDVVVKRKIMTEYIRPFNGAKVLDIGCATGTMSTLFQETGSVSYHGVDLNPKYIEHAKRKNYPGVFLLADIRNAGLLQNDFDLVTALDVLHHVNDDGAKALIEGAKKRLKQGGRFVLLDPVVRMDQPFFERTLMRMDRGKHIRSEKTILDLVRGSFTDVTVRTISHSYRIPWTECVFCCQ
jgi:SAM-dependent methyltransferase